MAWEGRVFCVPLDDVLLCGGAGSELDSGQLHLVVVLSCGRWHLICRGSAGWGPALSTELVGYSPLFLLLIRNMLGHTKLYQGLQKYRSTHGLKFEKVT